MLLPSCYPLLPTAEFQWGIRERFLAFSCFSSRIAMGWDTQTNSRGGGIVSEPSTRETGITAKKLALKPPVHRADLLRFTENDPAAAEDLLELLREFRADRQPRPEPE